MEVLDFNGVLLSTWILDHHPGAGPADWVADTLGALTAVVVYCRWHAYRRIMEYRPVRKQG